MAARAIWKGVISFGGVSVPVKLYSAVSDRSVRFHLLHDQDMVRVRQKMVNSASGEEVSPGDTKKGLEVEPGTFVLLAPEELKGLDPAESREIGIEAFVPVGRIGQQWYERPYYLGPDGSDEKYWSLVAALTREGREGIARWVMRRREYVGTLRVANGYLMLITLRHLDEVIDPAEMDAPSGRQADPKELRMAEQLVAALEDKFDPSQYRDEYRERVMELIEKKARGEKITLRKPERKPETRSLASALKASLDAARRGKEKVHA